MELEIKLPAFEGPMELLLHLIDKNKVNIYDIPIADITNQYIDYIQHMEEVDLDLMSDFLVMAATLLDIKARMLLPHDEKVSEEEEDPRRELVERLLQYKKYKYISGELKDMSIDSEKILYANERLPKEVASYKEPVDLGGLLSDLTLEKMHDIFMEIAQRTQERINYEGRNFGHLERETIPIESRIERVKNLVSHGKKRSFRALLSASASKTEVIVTFLAILELLKSGEIKLTEDSTCDDFTLEEGNGQNESNN